MLSPEYIQKLMRVDPDATVNDCFALSEKDVDIMSINKLRRHEFSYDKTTQAFNEIIIQGIEKKLSAEEIFELKHNAIKNRAKHIDTAIQNSPSVFSRVF